MGIFRFRGFGSSTLLTLPAGIVKQIIADPAWRKGQAWKAVS